MSLETIRISRVIAAGWAARQAGLPEKVGTSQALREAGIAHLRRISVENTSQAFFEADGDGNIKYGVTPLELKTTESMVVETEIRPVSPARLNFREVVATLNAQEDPTSWEKHAPRKPKRLRRLQ